MKGPIPDSYCVADRFFAGEYPGAPTDESAAEKIAIIRDAGVDCFVDLTEPGEGLNPYEHTLDGATYARYPIPDQDRPSDEKMVEILDAVDAALADGRTVYLHCWGGIGRTGTVVGCWLVRHGVEPLAALRRIAELRAPTPDGWRTAPENELQRQLVLSWNSER